MIHGPVFPFSLLGKKRRAYPFLVGEKKRTDGECAGKRKGDHLADGLSHRRGKNRYCVCISRKKKGYPRLEEKKKGKKELLLEERRTSNRCETFERDTKGHGIHKNHLVFIVYIGEERLAQKGAVVALSLKKTTALPREKDIG